MKPYSILRRLSAAFLLIFMVSFCFAALHTHGHSDVAPAKYSLHRLIRYRSTAVGTRSLPGYHHQNLSLRSTVGHMSVHQLGQNQFQLSGTMKVQLGKNTAYVFPYQTKVRTPRFKAPGLPEFRQHY